MLPLTKLILTKPPILFTDTITCNTCNLPEKIACMPIAAWITWYPQAFLITKMLTSTQEITCVTVNTLESCFIAIYLEYSYLR